jgi:hypothetical protein
MDALAAGQDRLLARLSPMTEAYNDTTVRPLPSGRQLQKDPDGRHVRLSPRDRAHAPPGARGAAAIDLAVDRSRRPPPAAAPRRGGFSFSAPAIRGRRHA